MHIEGMRRQQKREKERVDSRDARERQAGLLGTCSYLRRFNWLGFPSVTPPPAFALFRHSGEKGFIHLDSYRPDIISLFAATMGDPGCWADRQNSPPNLYSKPIIVRFFPGLLVW